MALLRCGATEGHDAAIDFLYETSPEKHFIVIWLALNYIQYGPILSDPFRVHAVAFTMQAHNEIKRRLLECSMNSIKISSFAEYEFASSPRDPLAIPNEQVSLNLILTGICCQVQ
jgi:hypothetical protein